VKAESDQPVSRCGKVWKTPGASVQVHLCCLPRDHAAKDCICACELPHAEHYQVEMRQSGMYTY
jgi:hypothetical protein